MRKQHSQKHTLVPHVAMLEKNARNCPFMGGMTRFWLVCLTAYIYLSIKAAPGKEYSRVIVYFIPPRSSLDTVLLLGGNLEIVQMQPVKPWV